eukprot:TRINITY_DN224_c0_g1_i5.p4 TRINITY_DN224_c0_g1~~TRINITY_DN224_c0_g1_i5.p4  ORF type:complete len:105 (-),score=4.12 TRINITY_DN224_c0_g1_i5:807-1121(-)
MLKLFTTTTITQFSINHTLYHLLKLLEKQQKHNCKIVTLCNLTQKYQTQQKLQNDKILIGYNLKKTCKKNNKSYKTKFLNLTCFTIYQSKKSARKIAKATKQNS